MKYWFAPILFFIFSLNSLHADELSADEFVELIQQGGYVIYFRHAATEHSQKDVDRKNLENCETQRNLSELGKKQSIAIGAGFKQKNIKVGKILSSPWCRARHTAQIAFGRVNISPDLGFSISMGREDTERLKNSLVKMLLKEPEDGTNTLLFSHTSNLKDATGIWPKPEGAMAIFKPDQNETTGYKYFGLIKPDYWLGLYDE